MTIKRRIIHLVIVCFISLLATACSTTTVPQIQPSYLLAEQPKVSSQSIFPQQHWHKVASPSAFGWNEKKLASTVRWAGMGSAAGVVVHKGAIIHAWGDVTRKYKLHSIRKTLMEALYGIYVEKGEIDLELTMAQLGIDDIEPLSDTEKTATIRQLLQGRSGVYHTAAYETSGMALSRPNRDAYEPGEHYYYNNWDFNTQLAIFEQITDKKIFDEVNESLAKPLQMEYYQPSDGKYYFEKEYSQYPAYPFRMSALDLARIGLLYLNKGNWNGQQILTEEWVKEATTSYSDNNGYGVGYKWKIVQHGLLKKHKTYFTTGRGGHRIFVVPNLDLVFVNRVDTDGSGHMSQFATERLLRGIIKAMPQ